MVVPWVLSKVISGTPKLFVPYVESARYAAEYRNYHWSVLRNTRSPRGIVSPTGVSPYPAKTDHMADRPEQDSGGNFGRFARTGIMDHYLARVRQEGLSGIRAEHWLAFFKIFQERTGNDEIRASLTRLRHMSGITGSDDLRTSPVLTIVGALEALLDLD